MANVKLKSNIFKTSNKYIFKDFFMNSVITFFIHMKMSKSLSAKYYQRNNERPQKKVVKDIKIFLRKKKKKSSNMVVNVT